MVRYMKHTVAFRTSKYMISKINLSMNGFSLTFSLSFILIEIVTREKEKKI